MLVYDSPAYIVSLNWNQVQRIKRAKVTAPQKRTVEVKPKPVRHPKSEDMEIEECSSEQQVDRHTNTFDENIGYVQISHEEKEDIVKELKYGKLEISQTSSFHAAYTCYLW